MESITDKYTLQYMIGYFVPWLLDRRNNFPGYQDGFSDFDLDTISLSQEQTILKEGHNLIEIKIKSGMFYDKGFEVIGFAWDYYTTYTELMLGAKMRDTFAPPSDLRMLKKEKSDYDPNLTTWNQNYKL